MSDRDIFLAALDIAEPSQRSAYLDDACGGDAALRQRVVELLESHEQARGFLAQPALAQMDAASGPTQDGNSTPRESSDLEATRAEAAVAPMEELTFLAPSTRPDAIGRLGHYEILEVIGKGGFGIVLKGFDPRLHRVVAIKVLSPAYSANGAARKRFIREARAVAAVKNEHVVAIYDVQDEAQPPFLVMECVDGVSLQDKIDKQGPMGVQEILRIGMQIAEGLAGAHKQGKIHRDIKPANILLENGVERVKITDFGLARAVDDASVTQSGTVAGTPMYMSPEQAEGLPIDHRSDLFSLGTVLYALCTGHPPFRASGTHAVLKRVIDASPRPIREINHEIPGWLCDIVSKLHAKKPEFRFQTAKEVAELLGQRLADLQAGRAIQGEPHRVGNVGAAPPTAPATGPLARPGSPETWQTPSRHVWPVWPIALLGIVLAAMTPLLLYWAQPLGTEIVKVMGLVTVGYMVALYYWLRAGRSESDNSRPTILPVALVAAFVLLLSVVMLIQLYAKHGEMPFWQWGQSAVAILVIGEALCGLWLYVRLRWPRRAIADSPVAAGSPDSTTGPAGQQLAHLQQPAVTPMPAPVVVPRSTETPRPPRPRSRIAYWGKRAPFILGLVALVYFFGPSWWLYIINSSVLGFDADMPAMEIVVSSQGGKQVRVPAQSDTAFLPGIYDIQVMCGPDKRVRKVRIHRGHLFSFDVLTVPMPDNRLRIALQRGERVHLTLEMEAAPHQEPD